MADWFLGFCEGQLGGKKLGRKTKEDRGEAKGGGISGGEETLEESGMGAAVVFESSRWDFKESSELCVYFIVLKKQN